MFWKHHIDTIANKLKKVSGILNKSNKFLPVHILRTLYFSMIQSQLTYGILAWGFEHQRFVKIQKRFIRIISLSTYNAHREPWFKQLGILKINKLFDLNCLKFVYNYNIGELPRYFLGFKYEQRSSIHDHDTRFANLIDSKPTRTVMAQNCIRHHIVIGITNWGFEWDRISKLQKRALRIMTNSRYNAHTEPLLKQLHLLNVKDIFDVQCMKFWYKFVNKKLPNYFRDMFKYNHEVHNIRTRSHDRLHLYPTRTSGARNVLRHHLPELLNTFPKYLIDKIKTHSLYSISHHIKCYLIDLSSYDCSIIDYYICNNIWEWQVAEV